MSTLAKHTKVVYTNKFLFTKVPWAQLYHRGGYFQDVKSALFFRPPGKLFRASLNYAAPNSLICFPFLFTLAMDKVREAKINFRIKALKYYPWICLK